MNAARGRNRREVAAGPARGGSLAIAGAAELERGGLNPKLFAACLARSQTLKQPETFSHRYPTVAQMREWVADPIAYRYEHNDGLKATMLLLNGLVGDFTVAVQRRDQSEPLSTLFYLPPTPNVAYSAPLMRKAEQTFLTGHSLDPVERTLLTGDWWKQDVSRWPPDRNCCRHRTSRSAIKPQRGHSAPANSYSCAHTA